MVWRRGDREAWMVESRTQQVLVVDDLADQRAIFRAVLENRGFQVLEAVDGEGAVRRAEEDRPDLILMDVNLPWMDGWEVTRRLKQVPRTAAIPIVAVSAHVGAEGSELADESGCSAFLSKTGDPGRIADVITRLIGEPAA
jgi:two-component system cell cycle response regulator DivK